MKPFNLDEYLANPNKKLVTRDGRKVTRVLCTNAKGKYPIIALVEAFDDGNESALSYTKDGHFYPDEEHIYDLFFAPEKHEGWVNIYKVNNFYHTEDELVYNSKKEAEMEGKNYMSYIDTIKIEWEE